RGPGEVRIAAADCAGSRRIQTRRREVARARHARRPPRQHDRFLAIAVLGARHRDANAAFDDVAVDLAAELVARVADALEGEPAAYDHVLAAQAHLVQDGAALVHAREA